MAETEPASEASSPDEEILTSVEKVREALIDARKSDVFRRLQQYYDGRSVFDIVGVSRSEDEHTQLLAWLFDPNESHGLGTEPLRRLLEAVVVVENKGRQETLSADVRDRIVTGSYRIRSAELTTEKSFPDGRTDPDGRIDLFAEGDIEPPSTYRSGEDDQEVQSTDESGRRFRLVIENKVSSSEHDRQTEKYYQWLHDTREEETRAEKPLDVPLFLTPISTLELNELEEPECACNEFIQINYQYLLDYVIVPCLQQDIGSQARWILEEYSQALSSSNNTDNSAMALGDEERELLNEFLDENKALFKSIMRAISEDKSKSEEERKAAENYITESSKDHSDVEVRLNGEIEKEFTAKTNTGEKVIRMLKEKDLLNERILKDLKERKEGTNKALIREKESVEDKGLEGRYRTKDDEDITYGGNIYYASGEWTKERVRKFEKFVQEIFQDKDENIEIKLV